MAFKPISLPNEPETPIEVWQPPNLAGGLCLEDLEQKLRNNQFSRGLNVWYADKVLSKRYGQTWELASDISANPVVSVHDRKYKGKVIFVVNTKMYSLDTSTHSTAEIFSGLTANKKGSFFVFNDILYYKNGAEYIQWNGTVSQAVVGKIPIVIINRTPTGGGDLNENYNRISAGFETWFNGDNTATLYTLPQMGLDVTAVTCTVGGVTKTEGVDFTVNRTTGVVTFTVAPATGQNNVKITAYKTDTALLNSILTCNLTTTFGGENQGLEGGTRIFVSGGGTNNVYWSALQDPTYFPDNNNNLIGSNDEGVTQFGKQYGILVIFKAYSIYGMEYSFDGEIARFPTKNINPSIGCDMPYTVQLIDNRLVWCNTYAGVHILASTVIDNERNVKPISSNINGTNLRPGLLKESDLVNASSIDFQTKGQYWLCIGSKVYMWDYSISPYMDSGDTYGDAKKLSWWLFDAINASCFFLDGETLYAGSRTVGNFSRFITTLNDFDEPINGYYRIPLRDFGLTNYYKTVKTMTITCRTDTYTRIDIKYITEREPDGRTDPQPIIIGSFSWANPTFWATFAWSVINFGKSFTRYPNSKDVLYWAVELSNNEPGRDISIIDILVRWMRGKKIK